MLRLIRRRMARTNSAAFFLTLVALAGVGLLSPPARLQESERVQETGAYELVEFWPKAVVAPGYVRGSQSGVFAESPDRIFLLGRGELKLPETLPAGFNGTWGSLGQQAIVPAPELRNCIVVVDSDGKVVETWTQHDHLFAGGRGPHRIKIDPNDPDRHVWVVDDRRQQIFKFTNDGKRVVLTLGEAGVAGNDDRHFNLPTDIAWLPDGSFFVSDGYANTRIVRFDRTGRFVKAWGVKGTAPGQFNLPHSVDVDRNRRVYVADAYNSRIQVFDENGKFLAQWPGIWRPDYIMVTADQHLWIANGATDQLMEYSLDGGLVSQWGTSGTVPGAFWGIHQFSVDSAGNLYAAETFTGRTQKFRPKPGADRSKLVGLPLGLTPEAAR
jgi:NHL repeat